MNKLVLGALSGLLMLSAQSLFAQADSISEKEFFAQFDTTQFGNMQEVGVYGKAKKKNVVVIPEKQAEPVDLQQRKVFFTEQHDAISKDISQFSNKLKSGRREDLILKSTGYFRSSILEEYKQVVNRKKRFCEDVMSEVSSTMEYCNCTNQDKQEFLSYLMKLHESLNKKADKLNKVASNKIQG